MDFEIALKTALQVAFGEVTILHDLFHLKVRVCLCVRRKCHSWPITNRLA
jgi:hypothetical protein